MPARYRFSSSTIWKITPVHQGIWGFLMSINKLLTSIPVFNHIPGTGLESISKTFKSVHFRAGHQIINEGDLIREVGIVASGKLIKLMNSNNDMVECGSLKKGDFFGGGALLAGNTSIINVYCKSQADCYMQKREDFLNMAKHYPAIKEYFYKNALTCVIGAFEKINGTHCNKKTFLEEKSDSAFFPHVIRKALIYIEKNFMNHLSLDEVARVNAMSRYHFSRIFRLKTGFTFKNYINSKRIQRAKYLMENEDMNITEAAFAVGYNDLSYFSRLFLKREGLPPSKYKSLVNSQQKKRQRR